MAHHQQLSDLIDKNPTDPRARLEMGPEFLHVISNYGLPSDSTLLSNFCDLINQWMSGTNFKVSLLALEILGEALGYSGDVLAPYLLENMNPLMERLGDSKEPVRNHAQELIVSFMRVPHSSPQLVFDKLTPGLSHKQWLVRLGVMLVLKNVLRTFGSGVIQLNKVAPLVCKLVADPNGQVRDTAADTLVEVYIFTGDKFAADIQRKQLLPESKRATIMARFQDAKRAGLVSENGDPLADNSSGERTSPVVFKTPLKPTQITASASSSAKPKIPAKPKMIGGVVVSSSTSSGDIAGNGVEDSTGGASRRGASASGSTAKRLQASSRNSGSAGALHEETFYSQFETVPTIEIFSAKDLALHMEQIKETLSDPNNDWDKRVDCLRKVRSVIKSGGCSYDEFYTWLRVLEVPFQLSAKDLRSQVVREACITIAYLSEKLGMKLEHFCETVLHILIGLIMNSAKVMSTSGQLACRFIIKNVPSPKLLPIVTSFMNSKSKEIKRQSSDLIGQIVREWQPHVIERNMAAVQEALRIGLSDADVECRATSRKAYQAFAENYREQAELLFQSLDPSRQRQLQGVLSQSSSNQSIGGTLRQSQENVNGGLAPHSSRIYGGLQRAYYGGGRSTSDIDVGAAKRAIQRHQGPGHFGVGAVRAQRSSTAGQPTNLGATASGQQRGASSSRPGYLPTTGTPRRTPYAGITSRYAVSRTPTTNKSISQPSSRSGSPTSRLPQSVRRSSRPSIGGGSRGGSRDQSPSTPNSRRTSTTENGQPGQLKTAIFDALRLRDKVGAGGYLDDFEMSDGSSVGSERSLSKFESAELNEALRCCTSTQWTERKDGLSTIQALFRNNRKFSALELKRLCDTFSRMFVDPHGKTFAMFLDTLVEFLYHYRQHLCDWLYLLLTRLLTKLGGELLASVQTKVHRVLEVVRESFPYDQQFYVLVKYIQDPAQTPSLKVKTALLNYLGDLISPMDASMFKNTAETRQAVSKIIQWTTDPKSADVRKSSQNVLIALFTLNAAEFTAMLGTLPKTYQDTVYGLLHSQLRRESAGAEVYGGRGMRSSMSPGPAVTSGLTLDMGQVRDRLRETSAQIQNTFPTAAGAAGGGDGQSGKGSQDSGIVDAAEPFPRPGDDLAGGRLMEPISTDEEKQEELISEILTELSNHNKRGTERCRAMLTLRQMARNGNFTLWDEHFKSVLLILLETIVGDKVTEVRADALRLLKDICLCHAVRFRDYAELTLLKVLEAHRDPEKDVLRAAEDCAIVLATHLPPHTCLRILNPVVAKQQLPTLLAAVKMTTKVIEQLTQDEVHGFLPDLTPGIVKAYESDDSGVRKASVLSLVALNNAVGEEPLQPYLADLNNSKIKLLNLYIKKTQSSSGHI